jgi:hypothetical protein
VSERLRGLFLLEPPPGGLERLRFMLEQEGQAMRGLELMPWVATACLLVLSAVPLLLDHVQASRADAAVTRRIVQSVRDQEPETWAMLSDSRADVRIHLARPTFVGTAAD